MAGTTYCSFLEGHQTLVPVPKLATKISKRGKKSQLLAMQRALFLCAVLKDTEPNERSNCARAYDVVEDRLRILDGKLKAGTVNARDDSRSEDRAKPKSASKPFSMPTVYTAPGPERAPAVVSDAKPQATAPKENCVDCKGDLDGAVKTNLDPLK